MNFDFSDEQKQLRDEARKFLAEKCPPKAVRAVLDGKAPYDRELWKGLAGMGFLGVAIPEAYGGAGAGHLELCVIAEEMGRALAPVPFSSTVYLAAEAILIAGDEAQKQKWWTAVNTGLDRLETQVLLHHQGVLYAGTGSGVYWSRNGGEKWTADNQGLSNFLVRALVVDAQGTIYAGTTGMGLYRKPAGASQWVRVTPSRLSHPRDQLPANFVRSLVVGKSGDLYAGTADNGVYVSSDRVETWRIIGGQLANASVRGIAIGGSSWFVGTGMGMYRSSDQGKTWAPANNGLTERAIQSFAVGADGTVYAGTSGGVFKTEDDGASWFSTNQGIGTARNPIGPRH